MIKIDMAQRVEEGKQDLSTKQWLISQGVFEPLTPELQAQINDIKRKVDISDQLRTGLDETQNAVAAFSAEARVIYAIANEVPYLNPRFLDEVVGFARRLTVDIVEASKDQALTSQP